MKSSKKLTSSETTESLSEKEIIAQNIAFFRKKMNLSQTELAKKLEYSNKNISKWELGETTPDIFTLKKLSVIFNVSLDTLTNPITSESKEAIKTKNAIPLRFKVYLLLMADAILILLCCVAFCVLKLSNIETFNIYNIFLYTLPLIDLSIFIFICCTKKHVEIVSLSLFGWLVTTCFYVTFIDFPNIIYVFVIGIGWQILAPIIAVLVNSGKIVKLNKLILKVTSKKQDKSNKKRNSV